jgi:hypothetical protein
MLDGMSICETESPNSYGFVLGDSTAAARLHLRENPSEHLGLKQPHRLGCEPVLAGAVRFEPLPLRLLADVVLNLLLQGFELLEVAGLGVLLKLLHIDDRELGRLLCLLDLLQQFLDRVQFLFHFEGLGHVHFRAAGELVLPGHLVDLVLLAEQADDQHHALGERVAVVADPEIERLKIIKLFLLHGLVIVVGQFRGRLVAGGRATERLVGLLLGRGRLVRREDLPHPFEEHLFECLQARPQTRDLRCIQVNGVGELFFSELARVPVHEQMFEERRHRVWRRRGRAREVHWVVPLVRVNDSAGALCFPRFHARILRKVFRTRSLARSEDLAMICIRTLHHAHRRSGKKQQIG